jgi:hypothetical protein
MTERPAARRPAGGRHPRHRAEPKHRPEQRHRPEQHRPEQRHRPEQHRPEHRPRRYRRRITVALLTCALLGGLAVAGAGMSGGAVPEAIAQTAQTAQTAARTVKPAAPTRKGPKLELRLDDMNPRVVTAEGPSTLTITGELTNTGDDEVSGLKVRPQRGDRLRTEGEVRAALAGDDAADSHMVGFTELIDTLGPGQRFPVRLTVPLRGPQSSSLALERTGVYPLLINVNSESGDGERTRVAAVRLLLPVLGLPPVQATGLTPSAAPVTPTTPTEPSASNPVTVLYPLADRPHRLPTGPGEAVVLGSEPGGGQGDELAAELAAGGRLDGLLDALETAAPPGTATRDAVCLAVDPDLLKTVAEMRGGYRLRAPDGTESEGKGADAATAWFNRLRAVAAGRCVVAIPFADADLVALSRAGLDDLAGYATKSGARIVGDLLGTPVRTDLSWPADGLLDERSLADFLSNGGRGLVLSSDGVAESGRSRGVIGGTVRLNSARGRSADAPVALLADPLLTLAAVGPEAAQERAIGSLNTTTSVSPAGTGAPLSGEDLTATLVFRALDPSAAGSSLLVAPPHRWNTSGADARELLATVGRLVATGQFRAAPLPAIDPAGVDSTGGLVYPLKAGAREVPAKVTARLKQARDTADELRSAALATPGVGYSPAQVFDPVTEGLLRAASAYARGQQDQSGAGTKVITDRVRQLRSSVRVLEPPSPFALGDREAPLPVTLANGLPVAMRVRVALGRTPGLRTAPIPDQQIPPNGRLQLRVNAQLSRSGQFAVEAKMTTLEGAQLGPVSRLQLRSTAYGTITLWLTGLAGALLVILAVRRITRRVRATRGRPPPPPIVPLPDSAAPAIPLRPELDDPTESLTGARYRMPPSDQTFGPFPLDLDGHPASRPTGHPASHPAGQPAGQPANGRVRTTPPRSSPSPGRPYPPPPPDPGRRPSGTRGQ